MKLVVSDAEWTDVRDYLITTMGERVADETMDAHFIRSRPIREDVTVIEPQIVEACTVGPWSTCEACFMIFCVTHVEPLCPHAPRV